MIIKILKKLIVRIRTICDRFRTFTFKYTFIGVNGLYQKILIIILNNSIIKSVITISE
jgi:hypothetical protein